MNTDLGGDFPVMLRVLRAILASCFLHIFVRVVFHPQLRGRAIRDLPKGVYPKNKKFRAGVTREGKLKFGPSRADVAAAEKDIIMLAQLREGPFERVLVEKRDFEKAIFVSSPS